MAALDVAHLPSNQPLLETMRQQHAAGREDASSPPARTICWPSACTEKPGHLSGVLASDGSLGDLTQRANKLAAFQQRFRAGFSYIGNAQSPTCLCSPTRSIPRSPIRSAACARLCVLGGSAADADLYRRRKRAAAEGLDARRPLHRWAEDAADLSALLLAHVRAVGPVVAAFLAFSLGLAASATYVFNDLLDLEANNHRRASAAVPSPPATCRRLRVPATILLFLALSWRLRCFCRAFLRRCPRSSQVEQVRGGFIEWLVLYAISSTTVYSLRLKRMVLVNLMVLHVPVHHPDSGRLGRTSGVMVSPWLAAFSVFFFLSLAFVKRF